MTELIPDMPPGTLGFRITDTLSKQDYVDTLMPPLYKAVEAGEHLRVLYAIGPDLHVEPSAGWADLKMGAPLAVKHRDLWERVAVVTDIPWLRRSFELLSWMIPGEVKLFHEVDIEEAKTWLTSSGG
jgi:hypothetical protein